jgi:hypothetical protein
LAERVARWAICIAAGLWLAIIPIGLIAPRLHQVFYMDRNLDDYRAMTAQSVHPAAAPGTPAVHGAPAAPGASASLPASEIITVGDVTLRRTPFFPRRGGSGKFVQHEGPELGLDHGFMYMMRDYPDPFWIGRGTAAGDFDKDGWEDVAFGSDHGPVVYRNLGGRFAEVPLDIPALKDARVYGVAFVDLDGDTWPDLFVTTFHRGNFWMTRGSRRRGPPSRRTGSSTARPSRTRASPTRGSRSCSRPPSATSSACTRRARRSSRARWQELSFRPSTDLVTAGDGHGILVQICQQCHNPSLDQTLTRAKFDVTKLDTLSREEKDRRSRGSSCRSSRRARCRHRGSASCRPTRSSSSSPSSRSNARDQNSKSTPANHVRSPTESLVSEPKPSTWAADSSPKIPACWIPAWRIDIAAPASIRSARIASPIVPWTPSEAPRAVF